MPVTHDDLFAQIANFQALRTAFKRAIKGKRKKPGAAAFTAQQEKELLKLERQLCTGTYKPGHYTTIELFDPKHRIVSAAPFRDRVVHHALCSVVEPLFARSFIGNSFANRIDKGTHRAIATYERYRNRYAHVLRCDVWRYFPSIDHEVLKAGFRRGIACPRTLNLMDLIVDGSNPQEAVNLYFKGDDLFSPFLRRRGLPIGNLTSQFFANLYLDPLDHFATEVLHAPYLRYVDDFALFHDDPFVLEAWRARIDQFFERRRLKLHPRKTEIVPTSEPAQFLGFTLLATGARRLPESGVSRFRNRLRGMRDRWRSKTIEPDEVRMRVGSWIAHASHADTWRLRHAIFNGGLFDPQLGPGLPPDASAFCAAVPGTTIQGTSARPDATGTGRKTETTMSASGSRARLHV